MASFLIALFGFIALYGVDILLFVHARSAASSAAERMTALAWWTTTPGLAVEALSAGLSDRLDINDAAAIREQREQLEAIASRRPMSSSTWVSLAGWRAASGAPESAVLEALQLSFLTGPNEGQVVIERAIVEFWQWEALPSLMRRQAASGLAQAMIENIVVSSQQKMLIGILQAKTPAVRQDIQASLRSAGADAAILSRIGL